jgi:UDP-2-acetamido-2,6-beta-L-arabino-hexul-4-ose reductase
MSLRLLITGSDGFIGQNLLLALEPRLDAVVHRFTRRDDPSKLYDLVADVDVIIHLAGVNRTDDPANFTSGNLGVSALLAEAVLASGRAIPLIYASSTQAAIKNPYGLSKRAAEDVLRKAGAQGGFPVYLFRLPNVFGKWARPNYNSAVATFCYNIARDLPITIHDPTAPLLLAYIDDVIAAFLAIADGAEPTVDADGFAKVVPEYSTTVGALADAIHRFRMMRETIVTDHVGTGLSRALYATYVSYLPPTSFRYPLAMHSDPRGTFVEMLRTPDCGQFSYFTAHPGVTRGGHYHHSKTEKFLVISGTARFRFRHMVSGETYELITQGSTAEIVDTVPGWTHDITNIGDTELLVMLWANELFDPARPDTFAAPL